MSARVDATTLLARALTGDADKVGTSIDITGAKATRWASATFVGARHRLNIAGTGDDAWLGALPEADLPLRGHLVADLIVVERSRSGDAFTATIEVLTVEEG